MIRNGLKDPSACLEEGRRRRRDLVVRFAMLLAEWQSMAVDVDAPSIVIASNGGIPAPEALLLEPKLRAVRRRLLLDECTRDNTCTCTGETDLTGNIE